MPTYTIDPRHSVVGFAVKHMTVSKVRGRFLGIEGTLYLNESAPAESWVEVKIDAASIDTGVKERDDHLRSADFFNVRLYPQIRFRSTRVERAGEDESSWKVFGELTIHGVTRPVILDATLEGRTVDVDMQERIGLSAETRLNRRDFGINWSGWMGRFVVSDEVDVIIDIESVRPGAGAGASSAVPGPGPLRG